MNPVASPEAKNFMDGESVRYAHDPSKQWYVLRCTFNRTSLAMDLLHDFLIEYYIPMHRTYRIIANKRKKCTVPLLPNIIFIYATEQDAQSLMDNPQNAVLSYYYDHCQINNQGLNPPLIVNYKQMQNFILATSKARENVKILGRDQCRFLGGELVRVIDGQFAGVEGRVARAAGEQRVVVELEGVCLFATAYVPSAFLRKL
jgi:transcription antitermination factor NusG